MTERLRQWLLPTARIVLGVALMVSGFTKAIDPRGTLYKLQEYAEAIGWGSTFSDTLLTTAAIALAVTEWMLGVALLMGVKRRFTTIVSVILMTVMTCVSLWLWIANPVSDCGCFGDAVRLTNFQTLLKNIILLAAAIFLWRNDEHLTPLPSATIRRIAMHLSLLYVAGIAAWGLYRLPLIDFRPYHVGVNIPEAMTIPEGETPPQFETTFLLEKDGQQKEFSLEDYPDSTWTFIDSRTKQVSEGYVPPIHDFSITDIDTQEDITQQLIGHKGYVILLLIHDLERADQSNYADLNSLYHYAEEQHIPFRCLTAGTQQQIEQWRKTTAAAYPFANTDETTLKTMARSNPALMLIRNGTILGKWSNNNLPKPDTILKEAQAQDTPATQTAKTVLPYLLVMLILMATALKRKHQK